MYVYIRDKKSKSRKQSNDSLDEDIEMRSVLSTETQKRKSMFFFLTLFVLFSNGEKKSPANGKINATQCKDERKASMYSYT
jgi:hypothetical protein